MEEKLKFYKEKGNCIKCHLCPHNCFLSEGKYGVCKLRTVKNNIPIVTNYGEITSANVDPIEKKPCIILSQEWIFYLWELLDAI